MVFRIRTESQKPRMYWACTHVPLRYEEVSAIIDAGFEVIPAFGSLSYIPFERHYDDESWSLYPDWQVHCTLPVNVTEAIRRIVLDNPSLLNNITKEEKRLLNKYIDVIYIPSFPEIVADALRWFKGLVIFRSFGRISNFSSYSERCRSNDIELQSRISSKNYLYLPIFSSLLELEESWMRRNSSVVRGFVSNTRLPFRWLGENSAPYIATLIKADGWEANTSSEERFLRLCQVVGERDCLVLGKNDGKSMASVGSNVKLSGFLQHADFYSKIVRSRIFIYLGDDSYHLHYTPLEAIVMGVPVLFIQSSPLSRELLSEGGAAEQDFPSLGAFSSYEELHIALELLFDDLPALAALAKRQSEIICRVFSRDEAVAGFGAIKERLARKRKKIMLGWDRPEAVSPRRHPNRALPDELFPEVIGQFAVLRPDALTASTGRIVPGDIYGVAHPVREAVGGGFLGAKYFKATAGKYRIEVEFLFKKIASEAIAYVEIGQFSPDYTVISRGDIFADIQGKKTVIISFDVEKTHENYTCELRVFSLGRAALVFLGGFVSMLALKGESL